MLILLPPSEGKCDGGSMDGERLSAPFVKPTKIATAATEKDLKCTGARYAEAKRLNQSIDQGPWMPAVDRYDGVMYRAIDYPGLSDEGQDFFNTHVRILSGMYGILSTQDQVANYKLPVTTALTKYWKEAITDHLNQIETELIIDLLPGAYQKMIDRTQIEARRVLVERRTADGKKVSHGVKGIKGRRIHKLCEMQGQGYDRSQDVITFIA